MSSRGLMVLLAASLAGCASVPTSEFDPITQDTTAQLRAAPSFRVDVLSGKELTHFTGKETAMVSGGILFGVIGTAIALGAAQTSAELRGEKLAASDGIVDPAQAVATKLRTRMQARGRPVSDDANLHLYISTTHLGLTKKGVTYFASLYVTSSAM